MRFRYQQRLRGGSIRLCALLLCSGLALTLAFGLGMPAAALGEEAGWRASLTLGALRSLDYHDGQGQVRRSRVLNAEGQPTDAPLELGRVNLDASLTVADRLDVGVLVPFVWVAPPAPVLRRAGLGDVEFHARWVSQRVGDELVLAVTGSLRVPTGVEAPGAAPPWGLGRAAITGTGQTDVGLKLQLGRREVTRSWWAGAFGRYRLAGPVQYLSHPQASADPNLSAELVPGHEAGLHGGVEWLLGRSFGVGLSVTAVLRGAASVRRARTIHFSDSRGSDFDPSDDVVRTVFVGPVEEELPDSSGGALTLTPSLLFPELAMVVEADLMLTGRNTRYIHRPNGSEPGVYDVASLGIEENAYWPMEPTGVHLFAGVLLGELRLRIMF